MSRYNRRGRSNGSSRRRFTRNKKTSKVHQVGGQRF
jgi:hypothetical protein